MTALGQTEEPAHVQVGLPCLRRGGGREPACRERPCRRSARSGRHLEGHGLCRAHRLEPLPGGEPTGPNFPENGIEFTYTITEQHGNRFAGTASGGKFSETLIGAISPDNQSGLMLDEDGEYSFTIRDADTLDTCYRHSFPTSRVVACWQLKRAKG